MAVEARLDGKVVIITGASSGIGAAACVHFARSGAHVAAVSRNLENLKKTQEACAEANPKVSCFLIPVQSDTKDAQIIIDRTLEMFGKIDVLVNNAGIVQATGSILEADLAQLDSMFNANLRSAYQLTKLVIPHLIETQGSVVNVSSVAGLRSFPNSLTHCICKAALDQFTKCVALEMTPHKIRINSVNPGIVSTNPQIRGGIDEADAEYLVSKADEVASVIVFLASEAAKFVNGVLIPIDSAKSATAPR